MKDQMKDYFKKWKLFYAGCALGALVGSVVGTVIALS